MAHLQLPRNLGPEEPYDPHHVTPSTPTVKPKSVVNLWGYGIVESMDGRPLIARVEAIANRFEAIASGLDKQADRGRGDLREIAKTYRREAATLHEAAQALNSTA